MHRPITWFLATALLLGLSACGGGGGGGGGGGSGGGSSGGDPAGAPLTLTLAATSDPVDAGAAITVLVTTSRTVTGLTIGDFALTNASAPTLSGSGASYTLALTAGSAGTATVALPAGACIDADGGGNPAATLSIGVRAPVAVAPRIVLPATLTANTATRTIDASISGATAITWQVVAEAGDPPPSARIQNADREDPTVTFWRNGTLRLRVTATSAGGSSSSIVAITVAAPGAFTARGSVADDGAQPLKRQDVRLRWTPLNADVWTQSVGGGAGSAYAFTDLIGAATDFTVIVPQATP